jgi:beta-galactosidase/beta-glucuronidase
LTGDATVHASAAVVTDASGLGAAAAVTVEFRLYDGEAEVAHGTSPALAAERGGGSAFHNASLSVSGAKLWSVGSPHLYTLVSAVMDGSGKELDAVNTSIGIRSLKYTGAGGMFINEEHVKVRGFCDVSDEHTSLALWVVTWGLTTLRCCSTRAGAASGWLCPIVSRCSVRKPAAASAATAGAAPTTRRTP